MALNITVMSSMTLRINPLRIMTLSIMEHFITTLTKGTLSTTPSIKIFDYNSQYKGTHHDTWNNYTQHNDTITALSSLTLRINTVSIITLNILALSITTVSITALGIKEMIKMTLGIMTFGIMARMRHATKPFYCYARGRYA
jgi:hypothetical protein